MRMERMIAVRNHKIIYRDGDRCIKVFNEDYSKADILNEALNQARVEETGLNIPRILEITTVDGKWAIVSEMIKGKTLARLMQENEEDFEKYLTMYADLQLAVHARKCPLLTRLRDRLSRKLSQAELPVQLRQNLQNRLQTMPEHEQLCHGDFTPSNIIIAGNGTPYILDWSHASQGDPAADAALSYLLLRLHGNSEGAQQYLDIFCQKSGTAKEQVQKWMPIVAAAQSVNGNARERNFLLHWANVVDYQ